MKTKKNKKRKDNLEGLVQAAYPDVLRKLIQELASGRPEIDARASV